MIKKKTIFKLISYSAMLALAVIVVMLLHMVYVLDLSQQTPYKLSAQQKQTDLYLITYADGPDVFLKNRNILASSAINRGFDFIYNYRPEHLDPAYVAQHPILQERIGAGYWLWKPYIILKTLRQVPEGSIVMYADSGLLIRQPLREFLEAGLSVPGKDVLLFHYEPEIGGSDREIASGDTFAALGCQDRHCRANGDDHTWAGFVVVRNSAASRAFIAEWLHHCENEDLIKGQNFKTANFPEFKHQQHDEGILSVLANRDAHVVNSLVMNKAFFKLVNMHRRKTDDKSLIGYVSTDYIHMERRLPNWWWVRELRKLFS